MFQIVQSIIELIPDSIIGKMQLRTEHKVYRCVWCGIPYHITIVTIKL